jgi:hypothetical protein
MRVLRVAVAGAILGAACCVNGNGGTATQQSSVPPATATVPWGSVPAMTTPSGGNNSANPLDPRIAEQREKLQDSERQKRLVADTDKLLALATNLKQQVDKTDKGVLSIDVIKKADEIEKLAHSVKEQMKK